MASADRQLVGVKVLDVGMWRPAPYAAQLLAELGAAVTKIEPPGGDPMRAFPALYDGLNRLKRVLEIDLKAPANRETIEALLTESDVVIEGFRPGVAARLGIGFEDAKAANPRVIHCSLSGFGQDGPLAPVPGHDLNYQAWSGVLDARQPEISVAGVPLGDLAGGAFAALAIVAALARRGLVGVEQFEAQSIDVSMADVLLSWAGPEVDGELAGGSQAGANFPAYGTFACRDGSVVLGVVTEDHFWRALCAVLQLPDLAGLDMSARALRGDQLRADIAAALARRGRDEVAGALVVAGVPAAPLLSRIEALALDHFAQRGVVDGGRLGHPVRFG